MPEPVWRDQIQAFLDGTLPEAEREALAARLEDDAEAAAAFDEALRVEALLRAAHAESVPLTAEVPTARVPSHALGHPRSARARTWRWAAAAAALVACGVLLYVFAFHSRAYRILEGVVRVGGEEKNRLAAGQHFEVPAGAGAVLELPDGSQVRFFGNSAATIGGSTETSREMVRLDQGGARFELVPGRGKFQIETPLASIVVLGTTFTILLHESIGGMAALEVAVASGQVEVRQADRTLQVAAGERRILEAPWSAQDEEWLAKVRGFQGAVHGKVEAAFNGSHILFHVTQLYTILPLNHATAPQALSGRTLRLEAVPFF